MRIQLKQAKDPQHLHNIIQLLYSMNQQGIGIHECKCNTTHIGKNILFVLIEIGESL